MQQLGFGWKSPLDGAISHFREMGAYEALWAQDNASFKSIAAMFEGDAPPLPSELVSPSEASSAADQALQKIRKSGISSFGVRVFRDGEYPLELRRAVHAPELIYYQGWWDLIFSKLRVAVVGTRNPTAEGIARTRKLVRSLVADGVTIVSGLAKGVDYQAHKTCMEEGGNTIGVLGTPITRSYPRENAELQREISDKHLLVSQVPINRYEMQVNPLQNRHFFPQRNIMMSALTCATVIVEAGQTSGTLVQAKAAIDQGRMLFILDNCFQNSELDWPGKFERLGAIRVRDYNDIRHKLFSAEAKPN